MRAMVVEVSPEIEQLVLQIGSCPEQRESRPGVFASLTTASYVWVQKQFEERH
jgi:hypothetical protein